MYQVRVSQRYGQLFVSAVFEKDTFGEKQLFPQCGLPLVFRTDASARNVAKLYIDTFATSDNLDEELVLRVNGVSICHGKGELLRMISGYWSKQSINIGEVTLTPQKEKPEVIDTELAAPILQAIYNQCL
ncbi:hypothetical protein OTK49_00865 [Vibrio coralliirubri]|uniref:hypothetical protein n=1 Tax=Vibrio coralliirubri TaxID=1516159 RepID=UPI002284737E|nr:hypothetical protein [Vibrio coralliirubri]MCY9861082.1 hypothetical protein [Vibrio coralliirubri]